MRIPVLKGALRELQWVLSVLRVYVCIALCGGSSSMIGHVALFSLTQCSTNIVHVPIKHLVATIGLTLNLLQVQMLCSMQLCTDTTSKTQLK